MNKKIRSTLGLVGLLLIILLLGGGYIFLFQRGDLNEREKKLEELNKKSYNTAELNAQYAELLNKASSLDSILANRKFNIPQNLSPIKFYNFLNSITAGFSENTHVDIEYTEQKPDKDFFFHEYKVSGGGDFNEVYRMANAIEQSKELKKIKQLTLSNLIISDKDGMPAFLVSFTMTVDAYFSLDNRFATSTIVENNLSAGVLYDAFFPLIRNEIPPNVDGLLDVQGAKLLALIPDGAFLADGKGNTFLIWEGEPVYLGYLTKIDYASSRVNFILNKGGIIEKVELKLEPELLIKKNENKEN